MVPNPDYIDPAFAAFTIVSLWSTLLYLVIRDGRRCRARHHHLNSSKED